MNEYLPGKNSKDKAEREVEPIPVQYIPRKPRPNGLVIYLLVSFIRNPSNPTGVLPFILDFEPHLSFSDVLKFS